MSDRRDLVQQYEVYLDACNRRDWAEVGARVADLVLIEGEPTSRADYVEGIAAVTRTYAGYRWTIRRLLVEGDRLAVHLRAAGDRVETDEYAMYRIVDGLIVEYEGTADNAR